MALHGWDMKKITEFYCKHKKVILTITIICLLVLFIMPFATTKKMKRNNAYSDKEDVALYVMQYHELPPNFITKYGYEYLVNHNLEKSGYVMGGDTHINTGTLSSYGISGSVKLKECDIAGDMYSINGNRGGQRLVYTCNAKKVRVFYTYNHYSTFEELTAFELQLSRNIFWIIFGCYSVAFIAFYISIAVVKHKSEKNI